VPPVPVVPPVLVVPPVEIPEPTATQPLAAVGTVARGVGEKSSE